MTQSPPTGAPAAGLRILHVIPAVWPGSGGPSRAVVELCNAVRHADPSIHVDIATTSYRLTPEARRAVEEALPEGTRLVVLPVSRWLDRGWSTALARWLHGNVARYDLLHIHALFGSTAAVAALIAASRRVPYIVRPLGTLSPYTFQNRRRLLKRLYFRLIDRGNVERSAAVHFTTPQEATKAARLGLRARGVVVPLPYGAPVTRRPAAAAPTILFLSRIHPVKGLDLLLPAFAKVLRQIPAARLLIGGAGDEAYERSIRLMVEQLGLSSAVEFHGFVQGAEKRALLARGAVFALPSYQENFGVAVVEALASGIPVVITRHVDLWPDVAERGSGLVVESTVDSVADALLTLLADADLRATMGAAAADHVEALYSPAAVGDRLAGLYREAAATRTSLARRIITEPRP